MKRLTDGQKFGIIQFTFISIFGIISVLILCGAIGYISEQIYIRSYSESFSESLSEEEHSLSQAESSYIVPSVESSSYIDIDLLDLPKGSDGSFKAWEDKDSITRKDSDQYKLLQLAEPNQYGFMCYDGYYLVAMGTYYAHNIGDRLIVCFENGVSIPVIIGDVKDDKDTVDGMYCKHNASIIEFIIDKTVMKKEYWIQGDLSCLGFEGSITMIRRVG